MTKGVKNSNGGLVLSSSGEAVATGIDEVNVAPLRKEGAPGFKLALTANTDVAAEADVPQGVKGVEIYCKDADVRVALGEVAVEGSTTVASVGRVIPVMTVCYMALDAEDVADGVKLHAITVADAATVGFVYIS